MSAAEVLFAFACLCFALAWLLAFRMMRRAQARLGQEEALRELAERLLDREKRLREVAEGKLQIEQLSDALRGRR